MGNKNNRNTRRPQLPPRLIMSVMAASLVSALIQAQPKIAVGIIIDGLRQEHLDLLRTQMGPDGFNRIIQNGVVLENVDYGPGLDVTAAAAVIFTGAAPSVNGIPATYVYDIAAHRRIPVLDDQNTVGNYTTQTFSPKALRTSTLADEARIAGAGVTYAHSIAADPSLAIVMAGHAANSAVWLNDRTANWAGSTFYTDFPAAITNRNRMRPLAARLDTMQWTPGNAARNTHRLPDHLTRYPFRHTFGKSDPARIDAFKASPMANTEVTDIATEYIRTLALGTHDGTDVLNITYDLKPYPYTKTAENRLELADAYLKLDADIARLLKAVDRQAGPENSIVFIAATPPANTRRRDDEKWNIPAGQFSTRRAISLLNLYLMAIHGNGDWVTAYYDNAFHLNAKLAEEHGTDIKNLREQAADFLKRMSGVERAYTIDAILAGNAPVDDREGLRRNTVVQHAGDVYIKIQPGWQIADDANGLQQNTPYIAIDALDTAPVYIMAPGLAHDIIQHTVDARRIAPTIAGQMHIRPPNGAALPPLRLTRK